MQPRTRWILYPYRSRKYYHPFRVTTIYSSGATGLPTDAFGKICYLCLTDTYLFLSDCPKSYIQKRRKVHPDFEFITQEGTGGPGPNEFNDPRGMCCEGDNIYICDRENHRIIIRAKTDLFYRGEFGTYGTGDNEFNRPNDICSDGTYFYIADAWNNRIKKVLVSDNSFVAKIGTGGAGDDQFYIPKGICYHENHIYITDTENERIVKRLASDLSFVAKIGSAGTGNDQFDHPVGICTGPSEYLYVSDTENNRIMKRKMSDLSYVAKIGSLGSGDDEFNWPHGIAYSDNYLYIADYNNHRFVKRKADDLSFVAAKGNYVEGIDATGTVWATIYTMRITEQQDFEGLQFTKIGTWLGAAKYRILCGDRKIYPEEYQGDIENGVYQTFNEPLVCGKHRLFRIQFRSTDDADQGSAQGMILNRLTKRKIE